MSLQALTDFTKANIIADKTGVEGGYTNNQNDSGGETNHGITATEAAQYHDDLVTTFNWDGTMRNLSLEMANYIYDRGYWHPMMLDQVIAVHPLIADKMFDIGINAGIGTAVKMLQTILTAMDGGDKLYADLVIDGGMGQHSLDALNAYVAARGNQGIKRLLVSFLALQGAHYIDIAMSNVKDKTFISGWEGRTERDMGIYSSLLNFQDING